MRYLFYIFSGIGLPATEKTKTKQKGTKYVLNEKHLTKFSI